MARNFDANIPSYFPEDEYHDSVFCRYCEHQSLIDSARKSCRAKYGPDYTEEQYEQEYSIVYNACGVCAECNAADEADMYDLDD